MTRRQSKVCTPEEAVRAVTDGSSVVVAGAQFYNIPMVLMRALIRQGTGNLTLIPATASGLWVDMLIAAELVKTVYLAYVGLEFMGMAPNFRRAAESGAIAVIEEDELTISLGLRAAAGGLPFVALPPIHQLTDLPRVSPGIYREVVNPFTGQPVVAIPPLSPDVALIHVAKCDAYGNAVSLAGRHMEDVITKAARHVIISTEELVSNEEICRQPTATTIPGFLVQAVVHASYGAHPGACSGHYRYDRHHLEKYVALAREGRTEEYLQDYARSPQGHVAYLEQIGIERLLSLRS